MSDAIHLTAPRNWQEVTRQQLLTIAEVTTMHLSREEMLLVLLYRLTGSKMGSTAEGITLTHNGKVALTSADMLRQLCEPLAFITDELPCDIECPLEGVNRHLMDTTFGAWFHADAMMLRHSATGDPAYIEAAAADLGWHKPMTRHVQAAFRLWWVGFKQWLMGEYPDVFRAPDPHDAGQGAYEPVKVRRDIMLMLNDSRPQDNAKIEASPLHDVLAALQQKIVTLKEVNRHTFAPK